MRTDRARCECHAEGPAVVLAGNHVVEFFGRAVVGAVIGGENLARHHPCADDQVVGVAYAGGDVFEALRAPIRVHTKNAGVPWLARLFAVVAHSPLCNVEPSVWTELDAVGLVQICETTGQIGEEWFTYVRNVIAVGVL